MWCDFRALTLSRLSLGDPLPDYPTGIIDGRGGLKLHRLHHIALANADFQRQHHHLGRRWGGGDGTYNCGKGEGKFIIIYLSPRDPKLKPHDETHGP